MNMVHRQVCEITFITKALHFNPFKATRQDGSKTETNEKANHPYFVHFSSDSRKWTRWQTNVSTIITFSLDKQLTAHMYQSHKKQK